ncbi:ATP-binding protein [Leptospira meyeri]|uniref:ATP-binding protein n=1 Tax=Leptospira meyeri TaxID=29508 RepID=UPI00223E600B|nr:ATP-binding protein [Leptospira meyeri]MCW7490970.1 ATP-binding protein [Leptospira meyeri]
MDRIDFLKKTSDNRLRKEIINICDSYNNSSDLLAELIQNSVDAIRKSQEIYGKRNDHKINIKINSNERSIFIQDTGLGIPPDLLPELLAPHGTNKDGSDNLIGEKGVGITYSIFTSNSYEIKSQSENGFVSAVIEHAASWKNKEINQIPEIEIKGQKLEANSDHSKFYTEIYLKGIEKNFADNEDIFSQSLDVLKWIIRTKTAIGDLKPLFENKTDKIEVILELKDTSNKISIERIENSYLLPEHFIQDPSRNVVELDEFIKISATLDDKAKSRKLTGKCLKKTGSEKRNGRIINYYIFFAPSRKTWESICSQSNLKILDEENQEILLYEGGIYFGTKGMPTGIRIEPPKTASPFYWPNIYMIIEDDSIRFDIGRKAIPSRSLGLLRDICKKLFNEIIPFVEYVRTDPPTQAIIPTSASFLKNTQFDELKMLSELNFDGINFKKNPDGQEASVVAIFHELLGSKNLKGYYTLKMGYKMTYDSWSMYKIPPEIKSKNLPAGVHINSEIPIIIEFKFKGEYILQDFQSNIKFFNDIDLIVCWDLDENIFSKNGVDVEIIQQDDIFFHGSTHKLIWRGSYNLGNAGIKHAICLRTLISDLKKGAV